MKELFDNIYLHSRSNDPKICFMLMEIIRNNEINSLEDLKKYEDNNFTQVVVSPEGNIEHGNRKSDEEILKELFNDVENDITHIDLLSVDEISDIDKMIKEFKGEESIDKKFILLIKMYSVLNWKMYLPYRAYNYILEDKLN